MTWQATENLRLHKVVWALLRLCALCAVCALCQSLFAPYAHAAPPCCSITAINQQSEIVTAKVNATGQVFEFKVTSQVSLQSLRVGEAIYANFTTRQVSLDGKTPCGSIVGVGPTKGPLAPTTPSKPPSTPPAPPPGTPQGAAGGPASSARPIMPTGGTSGACCGITTIDATKNLGSAKENTTGRTFQFKANNPAAMRSLKVGEGIYANFSKMQVSLDGKNVFGTIVTLAQAGAPERAAGPSGNTAGQGGLTTATKQLGTSGGKVPRLAQVPGELILSKDEILSVCQQFATVLPPPPPVRQLYIGTLDARTRDFTWNPDAVLRQMRHLELTNLGSIFEIRGIRPVVENLNPVIPPIETQVVSGTTGITTTQLSAGVGSTNVQGHEGVMGSAASSSSTGKASPQPAAVAGPVASPVNRPPAGPLLGPGAILGDPCGGQTPCGHTPGTFEDKYGYFLPVDAGGVDMLFKVVNRPSGAITSLTVEGQTVQSQSDSVDIVVPIRFGEGFTLSSGTTSFADVAYFDRPPQLGCFALEAFPYTIIYDPPGSGSSQQLSESIVEGTQVQAVTGQTTSQTSKVDTPFSTVTDMIDLLATVGKATKALFPKSPVGEGLGTASEILKAAWGNSTTDSTITHTVTNSHTLNVISATSQKTVAGQGLGPGNGDIIQFLVNPRFVWLVVQDDYAEQVYVTLSLLGYDVAGSDTAQALRARADLYLSPEVQAALLASDPLAPECRPAGFSTISAASAVPGGVGSGSTTNYPNITCGVNSPNFAGNARFVPAVPPTWEWTGTQSNQFDAQHTTQTSDLSSDSTVTTVTTKEQAGFLSYIFPSSVPKDGSNSTGITESTSTLASVGSTVDDAYTLGSSPSNPYESHLVNIFYDNLYGTFAVVNVPPSQQGPLTQSGTVMSGGKPVANLNVKLLVNGRSYQETATDTQGRFFLHARNLRPGSYVLAIGNEEFPIVYRGSPLTNLNIGLKLRP